METHQSEDARKNQKGPSLISGVLLTVLCALGWVILYMIQHSGLLSLEALSMAVVLAVLIAIFVLPPKH